ncbi:MAG: hypothetical protein OEW18_07400 [Candidatus Aminicenantes bacterium]|nr:hypothetical protein [Candidatus Aminicenantes bacterium]
MKNTIKPIALLSCLLFLAQPVSPEEKKPYKSRFSLKLTGGAGYTAIGDMNSHLESINNNASFEYWRIHDPDSVSGEIKTLNNWGYDFELELMMKLSPKFSIGMAASAPFRRSNESSVIFTPQEIPGIGYQKINMEYRPEIKLSYLIKISLYYTWLTMTRFRANIMGGIGYYPVTMSEYIKEITYTHSIENSMALDTTDWNAKERYPFGFHGGIGLEYVLDEEFSFIIDIQGRYVKFGNLRASGEFKQEAMTFRRSGVLYYLNYWHPVIEAKYDKLDISETDELGGENVRKAILDIGGFSLRVGVKINLF